MINTVVAYDDNDSTLGDYFNESFDNLRQVLDAANSAPVAILRGLQCNEINVNNAVNPFKANPFLFVGLSHGDETGKFLLTENDNYVTPDSAINFCNSFFYTTGCNAGLALRESLLHHGCNVFIGYVKNSKAPLNEDYNYLFIDCELHALKQFFFSNNTISELYEDMLTYTQEKIDWLFDNSEIIEAMDLQSNKDCMALYGDGSLARNNFDLN